MGTGSVAQLVLQRRNDAATVPVPFFRSGGSSKKGTGTVAGGRFIATAH